MKKMILTSIVLIFLFIDTVHPHLDKNLIVYVNNNIVACRYPKDFLYIETLCNNSSNECTKYILGGKLLGILKIYEAGDVLLVSECDCEENYYVIEDNGSQYYVRKLDVEIF